MALTAKQLRTRLDVIKHVVQSARADFGRERQTYVVLSKAEYEYILKLVSHGVED